jgi:signal transduction histidine kinase
LEDLSYGLPDDHAARDRIESIHGTLRKLTDWYEGIGDAVRPPKVVRERTCLNDYLAAFVEDTREHATRRSIELALDCPPDTVVDLDPVFFRHVLDNLYSNAWEAMAVDGGVFTIRVRQEGNATSVTAEDTGTGVPENIVATMFEWGATTKGSMGVGLAMVRNIVKAHGGDIELDQSYRDGARFVITMPTEDPARGSHDGRRSR